MNKDCVSRSLILTENTFSFLMIDFSAFGFKEGSSQSCSEFPLDLPTNYAGYSSLPSPEIESNPFI